MSADFIELAAAGRVEVAGKRWSARIHVTDPRLTGDPLLDAALAALAAACRAPDPVDWARQKHRQRVLDDYLAVLAAQGTVDGSDGLHGDMGSLFRRELVDAGGDGGECDTAGSQLVSNLQAAPVAGGQDVSLAVAAAFPDWSDRVDDVAHWRVKIKGRRRHRIAWLAWPDRRARLGQARPRGPVNRPVHSATTQQALGRILLSGLDNVVQFGKKFERYEVRPDGTVTAFFADGSTAAADVLVGADGANSMVRHQHLPGAATASTGAVGVGLTLPLSSQTRKWLPRGWPPA